MNNLDITNEKNKKKIIFIIQCIKENLELLQFV